MSGLIAIPASMPREWMYAINSLGLVLRSDVDSGDSAAVLEIAAS